jgi:hypothetical protein
MENLKDPIGNQTCGLPACNTVENSDKEECKIRFRVDHISLKTSTRNIIFRQRARICKLGLLQVKWVDSGHSLVTTCETEWQEMWRHHFENNKQVAMTAVSQTEGQ